MYLEIAKQAHNRKLLTLLRLVKDSFYRPLGGLQDSYFFVTQVRVQSKKILKKAAQVIKVNIPALHDDGSVLTAGLSVAH